MNDFQSMLKEHIAKYPIFRPTDAVKLAIQSALGGDHLISDRKCAIEYCRNELADIAHDTAFESKLYQEIGGGYVRLDLLHASEFLSGDLIGRIFAASAKPHGETAKLDEYIDVIRSAANENWLPFSSGELERFLERWDRSPVSHSPEYRAAYSPHYRVICREWLPLLRLSAAIETKLQVAERVTVAIDGMAGSGKTSAANLLAMLYPNDTAVIHADDFFLPINLRTHERLAEVGGNFHYERFNDEIATPLSTHADELEWQIFDCSIGNYSETRRIKTPRLTIVEGSYSLHPTLGRYADITAYLYLPESIQAERIRDRNGAYAEAFFQKWIPLENAYANAFGIKSSADIAICNY